MPAPDSHAPGPAERAAVARRAAAALRAGQPPRALVGFDGFVDSIVRLVRLRHGPTDYEPIATIPEFAARCAAAAGRSTNIERVTLDDRFGGNAPLMSSGLAALGARVAFIGAVGTTDAGDVLDPLFAPFAARCASCVPIARPGHTLCLEFDDGKIMINDTAAVQHVTWTRVVERVGLDRLRAAVADASILAVMNWSLIPGVEGIWEGLRRDVLPSLGDSAERRLFIDLSDPAKRPDDDLRRAMARLRALEETPALRVTLGLNLAEGERLARVMGVPFDAAAPRRVELPRLCRALRDALALDCVVIHPREGAAGAWRDQDAWFDGPFTASPTLSTGAGDHFNAGVACAQALGLDLPAALAVGCAVSGAYVRDGVSPARDRVAAFLDDLPPPEPATVAPGLSPSPAPSRIE